jgi:peptidyl-dipeptidase Dcp
MQLSELCQGQPFGSIPFTKVDQNKFIPWLKETIQLSRSRITAVKSNKAAPNFSNTCEALEFCDLEMSRVSSLFHNLLHAETNDELQKMAQEFSPLTAQFADEIFMDAELFARIKLLHDKRSSLGLETDQLQILEKQYKSFVRAGILCNELQKNRIKEINLEMSKLTVSFSDNVLACTNEYFLLVDNKSDLKGLPDDSIEQAAQEAKERGHEGKWAITLQYPSYIPFMTYAENRQLRQKLFEVRAKLAFKHPKHDNSELLKKIVALRHERAQLLGYKSHSDYVLQERMAETSDGVFQFLNRLLEKAKPAAQKELKELTAYAHKNGHQGELKRWDITFWSEKMKMDLYAVDTEILRPYFKLDNAIQGIFDVAKRLYGISFTELSNVEVYHPDVKVYEVKDEKGQHLSLFYADFHPRKGKSSGAWMTSNRDAVILNGKEIRPHVLIVCNFTKPTANKPSLLTLEEVLTLFHEFGHALHAILSKSRYPSISGTNVYWDFVELPSQIMENWVYEKECLDLFAHHFETGELIPATLVDNILKAKNFLEAMGTIRQLSFAYLDMAWHASNPLPVTDLNQFEKQNLAKVELFEMLPGSSQSCSFSHIFAGGYSAGYYSYKWAEVLDADAFEYFKEKGIFNRSVAQKFQENVLSRGGSEHPSVLYRRFRGRDADPDALLRRSGLL